MKIMSSFTHVGGFFLLLNTQKNILKNVGKQTVIAIDFHSMKNKHCKSMAYHNCLLTSILQTIFFYPEQKKETHKGLEKLNDVRIFIFGWTVPLRD